MSAPATALPVLETRASMHRFPKRLRGIKMCGSVRALGYSPADGAREVCAVRAPCMVVKDLVSKGPRLPYRVQN
jgi:hypothetical protein